MLLLSIIWSSTVRVNNSPLKALSAIESGSEADHSSFARAWRSLSGLLPTSSFLVSMLTPVFKLLAFPGILHGFRYTILAYLHDSQLTATISSAFYLCVALLHRRCFSRGCN